MFNCEIHMSYVRHAGLLRLCPKKIDDDPNPTLWLHLCLNDHVDPPSIVYSLKTFIGRLYESFRFLSTLDIFFPVMRVLIPPRGLFRGSTTTSLSASSVPWACRRYLQTPPLAPTIKTRATTRQRRGGKIFLGVIGGTAVGAAVFGVVPDVGHTVAAVERAGRVASALALCINECV